VYLSFQFREGWQCQFLEADLQTPLPKKLHFASSDKVVELVVDQGIEMGRGGLFLQLTPEQYAKLTMR
jgi:hypothetical protein